MIHARHQYKPMRDYSFQGDLLNGTWVPKPAGRTGSGAHANPMPPSLMARKPWLFDGTWRNAVQRRRDELRMHRLKIRRANKGRLVKETT